MGRADRRRKQAIENGEAVAYSILFRVADVRKAVRRALRQRAPQAFVEAAVRQGIRDHHGLK